MRCADGDVKIMVRGESPTEVSALLSMDALSGKASLFGVISAAIQSSTIHEMS
jgi:hypothetical protein